MKNYKIVNGNTTTYFINGLKKYNHYKLSSDFMIWKEYDAKGNEIYSKDSSGHEQWCEYDKNGREIHLKDSSDYEWWCEYDEKENKAYYRDSDGDKWWHTIDPEELENKKIEIPEDFNPFI